MPGQGEGHNFSDLEKGRLRCSQPAFQLSISLAGCFGSVDVELPLQLHNELLEARDHIFPSVCFSHWTKQRADALKVLTRDVLLD